MATWGPRGLYEAGLGPGSQAHGLARGGRRMVRRLVLDRPREGPSDAGQGVFRPAIVAEYPFTSRRSQAYRISSSREHGTKVTSVDHTEARSVAEDLSTGPPRGPGSRATGRSCGRLRARGCSSAASRRGPWRPDAGSPRRTGAALARKIVPGRSIAHPKGAVGVARGVAAAPLDRGCGRRGLAAREVPGLGSSGLIRSGGFSKGAQSGGWSLRTRAETSKVRALRSSHPESDRIGKVSTDQQFCLSFPFASAVGRTS